MDREILEKHPVLGDLLKWLGVLLCCAVEWSLFYESVYLYVNPSVVAALSPFCPGGTTAHGMSGALDPVLAAADVLFKASCGNG